METTKQGAIMHTKEFALSSSLDYFKGDALASKVTVEKYLLKNKAGEYLEASPDEMHKRAATVFTAHESKRKNGLTYEQIYDDFRSFTVIPQGSVLYGIGNNESITSVANCFAIASPADSYSGIIKTDEELVNIMKRRGGVGLDLSTLRPKGAFVNNSARTSDGIPCFMERYSNTTKEVAQNGRRGALMLSIHCHHPDILSFIRVKKDHGKVNAANISVKWTDDFLTAVKEDKKFMLRWPVDARVEDAKIKVEVNARDIWKEFIQAVWESAEPGCLYWDTIIRNSLSDCYPEFPTIGTNPCGELPLSAGGSCILILLNLTKFVQYPFRDSARFNYEMFGEKIDHISRLADDLVDIEADKIRDIIGKITSDPESSELKERELKMWKSILDTLLKGRRVGIGITGLADCLAMLGIKYDSDKALGKVENIFKNFHGHLMRMQYTLALERGSFPCWDWKKEKDCSYITCLDGAMQAHIAAKGRRNISFSTISPAGTVSMLAQTSSGVEPVFQLEYNRKRKLSPEELANGAKPDSTDAEGIKWANYTVRHHGLQAFKEANPHAKLTPYDKATAHDIDWKYKVKMQATIQKYITHSISNTCNVPASITQEEVSALYLQAWEAGCKGMTIYRDSSREGVLTAKKEEERRFPKRPESLPCDIHFSSIEGEQWVFFIGRKDGQPYEVFGGRKNQVDVPKHCKTGEIRKNGKIEGRRTYDLHMGDIVVTDIASSFSNTAASYTRMISTMLREGVPLKIICEQLMKDTEAHMWVFERGVARVLKTYIKDGEKASGTCESCGAASLQYRDGCAYCSQCGFSKCN
jgi:ribonucleoside-diphosphate reductase alpha chain